MYVPVMSTVMRTLPKTIHEGTFLAEVSRDFYESTVRDGSEISIGRRDSGIIDAVVV